MRYGNTPKSVFPAIHVMVLVGFAAAIFGAILMGMGKLEPRSSTLVKLFLLPPGAIIAALTPTFLFCIKLEDGYVKHVFLNRFILSQYPVVDFVKTNFRGLAGEPKIWFMNNRKIRFIGAYWGELIQLDKDLKAAKAQLKQPK